MGVRSRTKLRLVELAEIDSATPGSVLAGVKFAGSFDARDAALEMIYGGAIKGRIEQIGMRKADGAFPRTDTFTVELWVTAYKPGQTADEAEERVEEMTDELVGIVADNSLVKPALGGDPEGLLEVKVGDITGPDAVADENGEGWQAAALVEIECRAKRT